MTVSELERRESLSPIAHAAILGFAFLSSLTFVNNFGSQIEIMRIGNSISACKYE